MYLPKLSFAAIAILAAAQSIIATDDTTNTNKCSNSYTDFTKGLGIWKEGLNTTNGWIETSSGLELDLRPPQQLIRKTNSSDSNLPYNEYTSPDYPVLVAPQLLHYGKVTFELKAAPTSGAITSAIFMAPGGDEIDFEMLGGDPNHVQTNFFYGEDIEYNVNSANNPVASATTNGFHNYTIDWSPEQIQWSVDNKVVQTRTRQSTCGSDGVCKYPTHPSAIQFGLWDASSPSGTAQWAMGPINWQPNTNVTALFKSVTIECNSQYNTIV